MSDLGLNRREWLKTSGLASLGMVAGCAAASGASDRHRQDSEPPSIDVERIAASPIDIPPPVDWDSPREHELSMETPELTAEIAPDTTFTYMTFDGQVPGPMVRVRHEDRIRFQLSNPEDSNHPHNIDFHAVYGPGGGADDTTIAPGETAEIESRAMYPGIHIYHCAVPNFNHHISSGMFGAILVEPKQGLPEVDRELYFGQHEIYTHSDLGADGHATFDFVAMNKEEPTYVVFNGEPYAFTEDKYGPIQLQTDERVRIFFANGGPNLTSSWHAIGNVWSRLYRDGDLVSDPARYIETTPVAPGTVTVAEIETPVPGPIRLVDHAVTRAIQRGALGVFEVAGEEKSDIYAGGEGGRPSGFGHGTDDFDGWFDDVNNYTGVIDRTGVNRTRVAVGTEGNGGNFAFEPAAIKVSPVTTVGWEWTGKGGYHDVAHKDGSFKSELLQNEGAIFEHRFENEGVYKYVCTPHETLGMKGIIVVE